MHILERCGCLPANYIKTSSFYANYYYKFESASEEFDKMSKFQRLSDGQKTQIICLSSENISNREIARRLGCNESSVRRFLTSFEQTGSKEGRKYDGRPRILNARDEAHLKRLRLKDRFQTTSKLKEDLVNITNKPCSTNTIRRRLNEMGINACRPAKKPILTQKMRSTRLEWSTSHANWTVLDWQNVIFSDESKFNLIGADGGARVWRRKGERYSNECVLPSVLHSPYVMVWGAITSEGVGVIKMLEGSVNATVYKNIINEGVIPTMESFSEYSDNIVFQDDSAPCHRAVSVSI